MEIEEKETKEEGPMSTITDFYKYPSCEYVRNTMDNSESVDIERYNSYSKKRIKKNVKFNNTVTINNIQSHKKRLKKLNSEDFNSIVEKDFNEEKDKKCVNCTIF